MSNFLNDIHNTAALARLKLDEKQAKLLIPQLENILELVNQINSVDTTQVKPLAHPLGFPQPLRTDEVVETNQRDYFQKNAPQTEEGLYIVPKIIEN